MKTIATGFAAILLASPAPASTQCAWILWIQPQVNVYISQNMWIPLRSWDNHQECEVALSALFKLGKDGGAWRKTQFSGQEVWERGVCLPDSVKIPKER